MFAAMDSEDEAEGDDEKEIMSVIVNVMLTVRATGC